MYHCAALQTKFDDDRAWSMNHVLHSVAVSWERGDERPNELIENGFLPLHYPRPEFEARHFPSSKT